MAAIRLSMMGRAWPNPWKKTLMQRKATLEMISSKKNNRMIQFTASLDIQVPKSSASLHHAFSPERDTDGVMCMPGPVYAAVWNPNNTGQVASGSGDDIAFLWQVINTLPIARLPSRTCP